MKTVQVKLQHQTHGWKNIIHYLELRCEQTFTEARASLRTLGYDALSFSMSLTNATRKASDYSLFMESWDDSFPGKVTNRAGGKS